MRWLDILLSVLAGGELLLGAAAGLWLWDHAASAQTRGRKVAAAALALTCGALSLEALLFLSQAQVSGSWTRLLATLLVRALLLAAVTAIAALIWRAALLRR